MTKNKVTQTARVALSTLARFDLASLFDAPAPAPNARSVEGREGTVVTFAKPRTPTRLAPAA